MIILQDRAILKNAGKIIHHQENIEKLKDYIKEMEKQLDDNLQQTLMKSSSLINISKNLKQIQLMSQILPDTIEKGDAKKICESLRKKIYENQNLILQELQRSMLRAVEVLADAEGNLVLLSNFNQIVKTFDNIEKNM